MDEWDPDAPQPEGEESDSFGGVGGTELYGAEAEDAPTGGATELHESPADLSDVGATELREEEEPTQPDVGATELTESAPASATGDTAIAEPSPKPHPKRPPATARRITSHYALEQRLGKGGFSEVYLAEDLHTGGKVAVKQLLPNIARNSEIVSRFRSVADRTKELRHPNIVAVLGHETIDGRLAIVMEYVQGTSLRDILSKRRLLPVPDAMPLALQLCDALIYAHDHGFIHRDVKPENVLITPEGKVKLGDFDIAKITSSSALTRAGATIGTAYYMSPEQLRGQEDVDVRSDVFSMGVVLYEMLTGEVPIGRFQHPSDVNPALPHRLGSVILKALASDRGARYATIRDLREALTGSPEAARTKDLPFRFRSAKIAHSLAELVELCEQDWEGARYHSGEGHFDMWLSRVDPGKASQVKQALQGETDPDLELEKFLHLLDSSLPDPVLSVRPEFEISLGDMAGEETANRQLEVSNPSRGYLVGTITTDVPWLAAQPAEFRLKEAQSLQLTLTATAPTAPGQYLGQVTLQSNGGTVLVPISLRTTARLLFPRAGKSAGNLGELVDLCRAHRDEAIELFYNGRIEKWLLEGPMLFDLVARSQDLRERYGKASDEATRGRGLWAFLLACRPEDRPIEQEPFIWRTGQSARTVPELVALCEKDPTNAKWHLYQGHFATWLELVAPALVAETSRIGQSTQDQDLGLELFLHVLDPDLPNPKLEIQPTLIELSAIAPGERRKLSVTASNRGRGYLSGSLALPAVSWLRLLSKEAAPEIPSVLACPECGTEVPAGQRFCRKCGRELAPEIIADAKVQHDASSISGIQDSHDMQTAVTFGCLPDESRTFVLEIVAPDEVSKKTATLAFDSNGGKASLPLRLYIERRLLFPAANVSAGSIEQLSEIASQHWSEARGLWSGGQVREWVTKGLRHFDWVAMVDELRSRTEWSADMQLARFMLRTCPGCRALLPPVLEPAQSRIDLGRVLNRSQVTHLRIDNLGGGSTRGLAIVERPPWLEAEVASAQAGAASIRLQAQTRTLKQNGPVEGKLALSLRGRFGDADLPEQRPTIPVHMYIPNCLRVGPWRIGFTGTAQVGEHDVSVRALWAFGIGLASLVLGIVAGALARNAVVWLGVWLGLWLVGGLVYARAGLNYGNLIHLARDVGGWLKTQLQSEALRNFFKNLGPSMGHATRATLDWLSTLPARIRSLLGRR